MASSWSQASTAYPSQANSNPNAQSLRGQRGGGGARGRGRGRGRGGKHREAEETAAPSSHVGLQGDLICGHLIQADLPTCTWRTSDVTALTLHRADRHLILPPGGKEELDRIDPIAREERKEAERKARKKQQARSLDDASDEEEELVETNVISGLNITLSTPELINLWVRERRKRWPSTAVVEQKRKEAWDQTSSGRAQLQPRNQAAPANKRMRLEKPPAVTNYASHSDEQESSDDDGPPEAVSSRPQRLDVAQTLQEPEAKQPISESTMARPGAPVCRFWQQGRCNYASQCKSQHSAPSPSSGQVGKHASSSAAGAAQQRQQQQQQQQREKPRPRPKAPPPNVFQAPHLLRALLANEIAQHVDVVAQTIRFLVRNDGLRGVELRAGQAEEQKRRRGLVQLLDQEVCSSVKTEDEELSFNVKTEDEKVAFNVKTEDEASTPVYAAAVDPLGPPVLQGALPTLPSKSEPGTHTLFRPASPLLRPLTSLAYPPEPDPLLFLDPLRAADPKPLRREEIVALATDVELRSLLYPASASASITGEHASLSTSLKRALETLDALPSAAHRISALELIQGVSEQSPLHAHQHGNTFVRPHPSGGGVRARPIGEVELFRLGLRVGPDEAAHLRRLAQRISELLGGVEFRAETNGWTDQSSAIDERQAARQKEWEREADKRDLLRSLGVELD